MKIVAIPGALRAESFNLKLAKAMASLAPEGHTIEVATIHGIPLYDADVEAKGIPDVVTSFKDKIAAADGLLIVTPEYNGGIPGVTKNAIDWMSRPPADIPRVFGGKPTGVVGATPGAGGTRLSQAAWLPVLRALGVVPYFGHLFYVDGAAKVFDAAGALVDDKVRSRAQKYIEGFVAFVEKNKAG
jgi:chromate reductase, NAD(P)H dehydrogenase (quinone)